MNSLMSLEESVAPDPSLLGYLGKAAARKPKSAAAQAAKQAKIAAHIRKRCAALNRWYSRIKKPSKATMKAHQKELAKCASTTAAQAAADSGDDTVPGPTAAQQGYAKYCDDKTVPTCFDDTYPDGNGVCDDQSTPMCDDGSTAMFPALMANVGTQIKSPDGKPTSFTGALTCADGSTPTANMYGWQQCANGLLPGQPINPAQSPICADNSVPTCDDGTLPDSDGNCKNPNDTGPWCHNGLGPNWQGINTAPPIGTAGLGQFDSKNVVLFAAGALLVWYFFVRKG